MNADNKLPERKPTRLKNFDYGTNGAYFLTICTHNRRNVLSTVGDGASTSLEDNYTIHLKPYGKIVEKYLLSSENIKNVKVDEYVIMPNHIHVIFFISNESSATSPSQERFRDVEAPSQERFRDVEAPSQERFRDVEAPSPTNMTIPRVVSAFKRLCNKEIGENIFQRAYHDHIIRNYDDYVLHKNYILENPRHWHLDELYSQD